MTGLGGDPGLTPNLAALMRSADWAGTAIAASSSEAPAMASLLTGLRPWQHQVLLDGAAARLSPELWTLPKALKAAGYTTSAYVSSYWYSADFGYASGFDSFQEMGKIREPAERLAALGEGRQFVWVHIPEPRAPYV
ncbi:MAG: sulfatase-like hydrolase/transferase, partial [Acidobacteriota bacterium]|nr:sulfatase-like hydrolase/transferase [Acidobacteriota bacterium]